MRERERGERNRRGEGKGREIAFRLQPWCCVRPGNVCTSRFTVVTRSQTVARIADRPTSQQTIYLVITIVAK